MNKTGIHCKLVILIIVTVSTFCLVQITNAGEMSSVAEGHELVAGDPCYAPDQVLVRFTVKANGEQRNTQEKNQILGSLGEATVKHNFKLVPGLTLVKLPGNQTVEDALTIFNDANEILYAEPDYEITFFSTEPNDPNYGDLWGMHKIDANDAWPGLGGTYNPCADFNRDGFITAADVLILRNHWLSGCQNCGPCTPLP